MTEIHTSRLSEFTNAVMAVHGDFRHPAVSDLVDHFTLTYDTVVDQDIDPFSDEYFEQQLALYSEIAGRPLNQEDGELHSGDIEPNLQAPNPTAIRDVPDVAEQARSITTMLVMACLSGEAEVLDMGAGHGMSSEIFAFCGCKVHSIDIDPLLGNLALQRAQARNLDIRRSIMNFDDVSQLDDRRYDAAFFFQSFHHCLRPWKLIEDLKPKLAAGGVIAFNGEPMQTNWWRNWGLRLDPVSVFVARQHGWFESGWSQDFIRTCFARAGMTLNFFDGGMLGGDFGVATMDDVKQEAVLRKAKDLGFAQTQTGQHIADSRFATQIGTRGPMFGRPAMTQAADHGGTLLYGPYVDLEAGSYEISLIVRRDVEAWSGKLELDIAVDLGQSVLYRETMTARSIGHPQVIVRRLDLDRPVKNLEVRAAVHGDARWSVSFPTITKI